MTVWTLASCQTPRLSPHPSGVADNPNVVAYIDGRPVSAAQWQQTRAYAEANLRLLAEPGAQLDEKAAFESFLEDLATTQAAADAGFRIDKTAITAAEARLLQAAGSANADLATTLQTVGLTDAAWREELARATLAATYLEDVILAGVPPGQRAEKRAAWLAAQKQAHKVRPVLTPKPVEGLRQGDLAPDFEVADLNGMPLRLSDLRGKAVVLNFWATWCYPCREEMPLLQKAYETRQDDGLVVLGVDVGEDETSVAAFAKELGLSFPLGLDKTQAISRLFRVFGMPTTFFIDRAGMIQYIVVGQVQEPALTRMLDRILRE